MLPEQTEENNEYFSKQHVFLQEVVSLGANILIEDKTPKTTGAENIAPVILFRHFLDIIDSISFLVRAGNGDTPKMLLRPALEILLYLEYIFKDNTREKCISYMVKEYLNEIKRIERLDPESEVGRSFHELLNQIGHKETLQSVFTQDEIKKHIQKRKDILESEFYKPVYDEYLLEKSNNKGAVKWYQLYGGGRSIEALAKKLNYSLEYEVFYRSWSGGIHGSDLYLGRMFEDTEENKTEVVQIRFPADVPIIIEHTIKLSHKVFSLFLVNRIPEKQEKYEDQLISLNKYWEKLNAHNSMMI